AGRRRRSGGRLGGAPARGAGDELARRSGGPPRIARRLLRRVRDFAEVEARRGGGAELPTPIPIAPARYAPGRLEVDEAGFDRLDRAFLRALLEKFDGGPVGVEALAAALGQDRRTPQD